LIIEAAIQILSCEANQMVKLRRAYEAPLDIEGQRYLIDRLWPRGIKKENLPLEAWLKEIAPSQGLRKWFAHDPEKWEEFRERFRRELREPAKEQILRRLAAEARKGTITLIFASRERKYNNAVVIKELIEGMATGTVQKGQPDQS
jgi:uncharacterized protein YeaO (DUF488 family)